MHRGITFAALAALLLLAAPDAQAEFELSIAFDREEAMTSEFVGVEIMAANRGEAAVLTEVGLSVQYGELEIGPLGGMLRMPGSSEFNLEHQLYLVPIPKAGDLTITLTLGSGDDQVTASATVLVTPGPPGQRPDGDAEGSVQALFEAFLTTSALDNDTQSMGSLKAGFGD